jgi:hypothetical protein
MDGSTWFKVLVPLACIAGMILIAAWLVLSFLLPFWIFGIWRKMRHISDTVDRMHVLFIDRLPSSPATPAHSSPAIQLLECPDCHASSPESAFATEGKYIICPKCSAKLEVE